MGDNHQSTSSRSTKIDVSKLGSNSQGDSDLVNSAPGISATTLVPAIVSNLDEMDDLPGEKTPELQSKQISACNDSNETRTDNLPCSKISDEMMDHSNNSKVGINNNQFYRNDSVLEVQNAFKTETKSIRVQAREQQKEEDDNEDELAEKISETQHRILDKLRIVQTKMAVQEKSDDIEANSVVEPSSDSRNSSGDSSEDKKHQSDQQHTQDSDLSPSHSSISTKTNNEHEDAHKDQDSLNSSALGRNRRVRQKNSRFADFHCMQLVKGCRSKDDYEIFSPSTSATRSSNRRSTTDSSRSSNSNSNQKSKNPVDPILENHYTSKLCRKCGVLTMHDVDNQCQCCIYNLIVSVSKRNKTSMSQAKPKPKRKAKPTSQKQPKQQEQSSPSQPEHELQESQQLNQSDDGDEEQQQHQTQTQQPQQQTVDDKQEPTKQNDSQKRKWVVKASKSANDDNVISICREIDSSNQDNIGQRESNDEPIRKVIIKTNDDGQVPDGKVIDSGDTKRACDSMTVTMGKSGNNSDANDNKTNNVDNSPDYQIQPAINNKPETWTPDQVAQYVWSKGFTSESDLFRQQAVDGLSLLMMKRQDFTYGLKMKLGPALKLYEQVCRLRREFDRETATAS